MLRTKPDGNGGFNHNSYNSSDEVNSIKWETLEEEEYQKVFEYYKGLIAFRKAHPVLRLATTQEITDNVKSVSGLPANVIAFEIKGGVNGEPSDGLYVIFNPTTSEQRINLPGGKWDVCINGEKAGTETLDTVEGTASVAPISALVLVKGKTETPNPGPAPKPTPDPKPDPTPDTDITPPAVLTPESFSDLEPEAWYYSSVSEILSFGYLRGVSDDTFAPDDTLDRGMAVTILHRMKGEPESTADTNFTDVDTSAYYAEAVRWAASNNVVLGVDDTHYDPDRVLSRQEFAVMLWRYAKTLGIEVSTDGAAIPDKFVDREDIASWADEAVCWAYHAGILTGKPDNIIDPSGQITRAEACTMVSRFLSLEQNKDSAKD